MSQLEVLLSVNDALGIVNIALITLSVIGCGVVLNGWCWKFFDRWWPSTWLVLLISLSVFSTARLMISLRIIHLGG